MSYVWLDDLDEALNSGGIPFTEVGYQPTDPTGALDWRRRGRPRTTGDFEAQGILCHHTASPAGTTNRLDVAVILSGNSAAPGPISQLYIGRDAEVVLIAAGRANHGGRGRRPGVDTGSKCADMNATLLGIEAGNSGVGERWPDDMTTMYARVVATLCKYYGWDIHTDVFNHFTTGPPNGGCNSKIDPAGPWQKQPTLVGSTPWDLGVWRGFCAAQQPAPPKPPVPEPAPVPSPIPPLPGDDDMPRIGPLFIQATGKDGTQPGVVYLPSGDGVWVRRIVDEDMLKDVRYQLLQAGYTEAQVNAPPQPVDRVASFGAVANPA